MESLEHRKTTGSAAPLGQAKTHPSQGLFGAGGLDALDEGADDGGI